ncbi:MAG TPA: DUF1294 domain-containing protein [Bellilinea sp.]|nr:DUF1294 domain-containing protein [Bellilinea sp.]
MTTGLSTEIILLLINLINFVLYGLDKFFAIRKMYRIPERILLTISLLAGGIGGLAGMNLFRHKTHKWYFWVANLIGIGIALFLLFKLAGVRINLQDFIR